MSDYLMQTERLGALRQFMREQNAHWPAQLVPVDESEWPWPYNVGVPPCGLWRSRGYLVAAYRAPGGMLRLSVNRTQVGPDRRWLEGIRWDDLQRLKREAGFGDRVAVEVFPADADLVDVANMRHLWIYPAGEEPAHIVWHPASDGKDGE